MNDACSKFFTMRMVILIVCILLFASCASEDAGRFGMPSWWNEPESPENICNQFVIEKCDYDNLSQIPFSERQRLASSAISQARERIFGFFKASSLPSDLFNIGREAVVRLEDGNTYIARVEIPYQYIYDYNPNVMRMSEEGRRQASKKYAEAVAFYEEYQDAKAVRTMFEAACISYENRVVTGDFSYKRLIGIATGMLRKIEIVPDELSSNMDRSVFIRRSSNIIKEGVSGATIRMFVSADDNTPVYAVDYVTDEDGVAFFDKTSYMLPKRCRLDYALELDLTSQQRRLGNIDSDFQSFFDVLSEKRFSDTFEQPENDEQFAVLSFMRDGNDILAANEELQNVIVSNNGVYKNMSFVNLLSEFSADEIASYIESDRSLSKCSFCLISIMITDDEKRLGDSFVLHAPCDLYVYDGRKNRIVKSLVGLENVGIGSDRLQARSDLVGNQIAMLSKYMLELFGRLLDGIE